MQSPVGNGSPKSWWTLQLWERAGRSSRSRLVLAVLMLALPGCMTTGHQSTKGLDPSVRSAPPRGALNDPPTNQKATPPGFLENPVVRGQDPGADQDGGPQDAGSASHGCTSGVDAAASAAESPSTRPACQRPGFRPFRFRFGPRGRSGRRSSCCEHRQHTGQRRRRQAPGESCQHPTERPEPDRATASSVQSRPERNRSTLIPISMPTRQKSTTIASASTRSTTASSSPGS